MNTPKCSTCRDTGHRDPSRFDLDCTDCDVAEQRVALEKWCNETQQRGPSMDDCWAIHQRALAMAPKQEAPAGVVAWMSKNGKETTSAASKEFMETCGYGVWHEIAPRYVIPLVAAPAAANGAPEGNVIDYGTLPDLPEKDGIININVYKDVDAWDADSMRAYGQACAAAANSGSKNSSSCTAAVEVDALDAALQRAAGELPDGYTIRVEVELGAGGVEWSGGDAEGSVDHQESLASDVLQALEDAKEHAAAAGSAA